MNIREATKICFLRYKNEFQIHAYEINNLIDKALVEIDNYPIDKLSRWLGFVQGYVILNGQTTIEKERDFSRPLFHEAYSEEGIEIPKSFNGRK